MTEKGRRVAKTKGFTADERAAMKERAAEQRAEAKREKGAAKAAAELQDVLDAGPSLAPKTWYGMPAYALDGKVVCFFQSAGKFDARYCTLGFNDPAALDEGSMWPTSFAVTAVGATEEKRIAELVRRAVG
jgi:uncharacterized protein YdhG (YjbR/CyaY superfamily)